MSPSSPAVAAEDDEAKDPTTTDAGACLHGAQRELALLLAASPSDEACLELATKGLSAGLSLSRFVASPPVSVSAAASARQPEQGDAASRRRQAQAPVSQSSPKLFSPDESSLLAAALGGSSSWGMDSSWLLLLSLFTAGPGRPPPR